MWKCPRSLPGRRCDPYHTMRAYLLSEKKHERTCSVGLMPSQQQHRPLPRSRKRRIGVSVAVAPRTPTMTWWTRYPQVLRMKGPLMTNSFGSRATLRVGDQDYTIHRLDPVYRRCRKRRGCRSRSRSSSKTSSVRGRPRRSQGRRHGPSPTGMQKPNRTREIAFTPARVLLQDFTGVPAVVDLAAMRDAMVRSRRRSEEDQSAPAGRTRHRPHSVQVDDSGNSQRVRNNTHHEYERNQERYVFLAGGRRRSAISRSCRRTEYRPSGQSGILARRGVHKATDAIRGLIRIRSSARTRHSDD